MNTELTNEFLKTFSHEELMEEAACGNSYAQYLVSDRAGKAKDTVALLRMAAQGWEEAIQMVGEGYFYGWYGFEKDEAKAARYENM